MNPGKAILYVTQSQKHKQELNSDGRAGFDHCLHYRSWLLKRPSCFSLISGIHPRLTALDEFVEQRS